MDETYIKKVLLKNMLNLNDDNFEIKCSDNTKSRIDILINNYIIEVKKISKWDNAVGQIIKYYMMI